MIFPINKCKNIISKNKTFFIIYFVIISIVILTISILSILGNIERKGYLSEFTYNGQVYGFKVNYYSKIFRNSDIYYLYAYFHVQPEYIKKIEYQEGGSPFGVLYSEKNLLYDDKIDVFYRLKVKIKLIIYILAFILFIPLFYFKLIKINYLLLIVSNIIVYYVLIGLVLPSFNMIILKFTIGDIILSNLFLIIAYHLYNKKILLTIIFFIFQTFSFFVIEPIALTVQSTILLFSDIPILYMSLIEVLPTNIKIITIISTIVYFICLMLLIYHMIKNIIKMKKKKAIIVVGVIFLLSFFIFFRGREIDFWNINFISNANMNGIIDSINYKINYNKITSKKYSRDEVLEALNILIEKQGKRDFKKLLLSNNINSKRDIFLIFLESFYDYSHFTNLFDKDPFPMEYRDWANNSRKISPNDVGGSFYARLSGLTGSSPLYPKSQSAKLTYTLPYLLADNGYTIISLEEAFITYNLNNFLPMIGITNMVFNIGITNIDAYLDTNFNNFNKPIFVYGFTFIGHTGTHTENNFNIEENNKNFLAFFKNGNTNHLMESLDNSVITSIEILRIRDVILKYSPNALIIFKHDHLYPYLKSIVENSSIEDNIKNNFLNDNTPNPILIWDGTNGAYKAPNNFVPENIPMFIALNAGVTNYENSMISLLYKEEIDGIISTYHKFYKVTNDTLVLENDISKDSEIFKYENAQRILSQDIFQGKKHYYDLIKDVTNK